MVEGSGSKMFLKVKKLFYIDLKFVYQLLEKILEIVIVYFKLKVESGVQFVQVFDFWVGIFSLVQYWEFVLFYIKVIVEFIIDVFVIVFLKGVWFVYEDFGQVDCQVVGLDWNMFFEFVCEWVGFDKVLQGNLDFCQLYVLFEEVVKVVVVMLDCYGRGYIVNLGYGVYLDMFFEGVKVFVNVVWAYQYK